MRSSFSYEQFFRYATDFFCLMSRDGDLITSNPSLNKALDYPGQTLIDLPFISLVHPDDRQYSLSYLDAVLAGLSPGNLTHRLRKQNGDFLTVEWRCVFDSAENIIYCIGQASQSADSVKHQLRESENRYRTLLEGASVAMLVIDANGIIQMTNRRGTVLFEYEREELIGKHFHMLLPGTVRDRHGQLEVSYWVHPSSRPMGHGANFTAVRKDGTEFAADIALSHMLIDDAPHVVAFVSDLTDRLEADRLQQELEKEKELRRLKSRFLSMVAHDFRTPLTLIMSTAGMLRMLEGKISQEQRIEQLNKIDHQVSTLSQLLDEVSFINKNEMAGYKLDLMPVDVCIFLRQKTEELQNTYQKPITVKVRCPDTTSRFLLDELLINKIFSNLISNAIKYCDSELGEVHIEFDIVGDWIEVSIYDNGIGIPEKDQRYVFEAFHRGENVGQITGSGLGLMIVKQSVEVHGGRIEFVSDIGKGTTFSVYLPANPIR